MLISESISHYQHIDIGNIKIVFTIVCKSGWFRNVYINCNSIYMVKSGSAILKTNNEAIELQKGQVVLIKQHTQLDIKKSKDADDSDFQSFIFQLYPDFVKAFLASKKQTVIDHELPTPNIIPLSNTSNFGAFSENLMSHFNSSDTNQPDLIRAKTFEALSILEQENFNFLPFLVQNAKPVKIDIYEFMINNVLSNDSVEELAKLTGRSLSSFKRDFKAIFNTSPHQWILQQKMDYAEKLLKEKGMKVSEFYLYLGFKELSNFSIAYKKIKGIAPSSV